MINWNGALPSVCSVLVWLWAKSIFNETILYCTSYIYVHSFHLYSISGGACRISHTRRECLVTMKKLGCPTVFAIDSNTSDACLRHCPFILISKPYLCLPSFILVINIRFGKFNLRFHRNGGNVWTHSPTSQLHRTICEDPKPKYIIIINIVCYTVHISLNYTLKQYWTDL